MTFRDLPEKAAGYNPSTGEPIVVVRGEKGYWLMAPDFEVDAFNARHGVTPAQREALLYGSVYGFDKPIADPTLHADASKNARRWGNRKPVE
jgi:hypothetical protein